MNGGSVPSFIPAATSVAACSAHESSSASGLVPYPSSKSIRKSSIGSRVIFSTTRRYTVSASAAPPPPSAPLSPIALANDPASGAYSRSDASAISPSRRAESRRNRCAPP